MSIPYKMRPTGFDSWQVRLYRDLLQLLGSPEKFELAWIAPEKKLIIHTDRVDDATLAEVAAIAATLVPVEVDIVQYNHHIEVSWKDINKYAECTNIADMLAVNPDFKNDVTSDGAWIYPLPEMVNFNQRYPNNIYEDTGLAGSKTVKIVDIVLPKAKSLESVFRDMRNLEHLRVIAPTATTTDHTWNGSRKIKTIEFYLPKADRVHCGDITSALEYAKIYAPLATEVELRYCPKLTTLDAEFPSLAGTQDRYGGFANGSKLNKESVLKILNSIPAYTSGTHKLTIGIHVDLQNDPEVLVAIANAEAKGWMLTVQWNPGGPTYTTPTT